MNTAIMKIMGYSNELEMVNNGLCPMCGVHVGMIPFKDEASRREYKISGLCQKMPRCCF